MGKITKRSFAKKRRISEALFCMAVKGHRNLGPNNAFKVSRALGTGIGMWRESGFDNERLLAWEDYVAKFNGGGK